MRLMLVLLAMLLIGCSTGNTVSQPVDAPIKEFEVVAKQFSFEPAVITVNEGDYVKLTITNPDVTHGISIPAFGVSTRIDPGKDSVVEFYADKAGFFEYRCNVFCGSGHGAMLGAIEVLEAAE